MVLNINLRIKNLQFLYAIFDLKLSCKMNLLIKLFKKTGLFVQIYMLIGFLFFLEYKLPNINSMVFIVLRYIAISILFFLSYKGKKMSLWIFAAMIFGVEFGMDFPTISLEMARFGKIFLNLIKSLVAPLIFATLVVGIAGHSNIKQVGRMGLKSILYFEIVTTIALFVGLLAINTTQAGKGVNIEARSEDSAKASKFLKGASVDIGSKKNINFADIKNDSTLTEAQKLKIQIDQQVDLKLDSIAKVNQPKKDHLVDMFPENITKAITENNTLQVVIFSIIFAIGLGMVKNQEHRGTMLNFFEGLSQVMFKFTDIVMYLAPLAVFGALASTIATSGVEVLQKLFMLVGTLYIALIAFVLCVFLPIALIAKVPIKQFLKAVSEPVSLAFATASSESALPIAMENLEKFGVSKKVVAFVLPTGYSFNLDGTTLYLSLASVFVAQMCNIDLTLGQQITMCLIFMLTSKGVAGVRGASFVILAGTIAAMDIEGFNPERASVILAVDALMDMGRTSINVLGNCLASVVIAKSEGEFDVEKANSDFQEEIADLSV